MAASTGSGIPNHIYIHSLIFQDREPILADPDTEIKHNPFNETGVDVLSQSEEKLLDIGSNVALFNKELIRNSNLYATLISEYHHNT